MIDDATLRKTVRQWIDRADADLAFADDGGDEARRQPIRANLYQQAAEKHLKALLIAHRQRVVKTHDLDELLDMLEQCGVRNVDSVRAAEALTQYAVDAKYPTDTAPVNAQEAERAADLAREVRDFVLTRLPFSLDD